MGKIQSLSKNKAYSKIPAFKKLYGHYKDAVKAYKEAAATKKKIKAKYKALKKEKNISKRALHIAACAVKLAKNEKRMHRRIMNVSAKHLVRWVRLFKECQKRNAELKAKEKSSTKKKKAAKPTAKKTSKPKAAKTKTTKAKPTVKKIKPAKAVAEKTKVIKVEKPTVIKIARSVQPAKTKRPATKPVAARPAAKKTAVRKAPVRKTISKKDNLKRIEGVGPKIEGLMNAAGIHTFNQVARSSVARLQGILDKAGSRYNFADPGTWPQQAKLANTGKWDELAKWQAELKGGKKG